MKKSVVIVGAGISGLTAGCYAQMSGFETTVYEANDFPGGLCSSWERNGYIFDTSMRHLTGSSGGPLNKLWRELGVVPKFSFYYHNPALHFESMGKSLSFTNNRKKLLTDMLAISPEDTKIIHEFIDLIFGHDLTNATTLNPFEMQSAVDKIKALPFVLRLMPNYFKYKSESVQQFALKFNHPFLREAVRFFIDTPGWPMPRFPLALMSGFMKSSVAEAGTPIGGSHKVVRHIAEMFEKLGGVIKYNSKVTDLIVEDGKAKGIVLSDNEEKMADFVFWTADGHSLIFDILNGNFMDENIRKMYFSWKTVKPVLQVMIGVNRDLSEEPTRLLFQPDEPIKFAGEEHKWLNVIHQGFDKNLAPAGKTTVEVLYDTDYEYWKLLSKHPEDYVDEKQRIADYTLAQLEKRWPGFAGQVEVIDIATPATYARYTGNWKASPDGWYITVENWMENHPLRTLPGLHGLYLAGQWTAPFTGALIAALSGRQIVQMLCKKEGKKFRSKTIQKMN